MKAAKIGFVVSILGAAIAHIMSGPAYFFPLGTLIWFSGIVWMIIQSILQLKKNKRDSLAILGRAVFAFLFFIGLFFFIMVLSFHPD